MDFIQTRISSLSGSLDDFGSIKTPRKPARRMSAPERGGGMIEHFLGGFFSRPRKKYDWYWGTVPSVPLRGVVLDS